MNRVKQMLSRILRGRSLEPKSRRVAATLLVTFGITALAVAAGLSIFRPFPDDSGKVQSAPSNVKISTTNNTVVPVATALDGTNPFFSTNFGTNGQACVTCHQPSDGFTIHVASINTAFQNTGGADPLFRPNDTANNPNTPATDHDPVDYSLILNLGVIRIGKSFAANTNFTAEAANQATNTKFGGPFPLGAGNNPVDPQQGAGHPTLSLFRRPLVNTNVHLDSSVLWDGRAAIGNMRAQVIGAAKTLLLNPNPTNEDSDGVAAFMLGVYTDQVFDTAAGTDANGNCTFTKPGQQCGAGLVSARGATAGIDNLVKFALSSNVPCSNFLETTPAAGGKGCVPNTPGYDVFQAWGSLPDEGENAGRLSAFRGEELFNSATLHVPADLVGQFKDANGNNLTEIHCTTCHAGHNIGNNPSATFFARVGTDSLSIIQGLLDNPGNASSATLVDVQGLMDRVSQLPVYKLTATGANSCGISTTETTDPGRAMVSGNICDVGKFKPPTLRGLAARSPYFHAGAAENIQMLIHFYNARFQIGLNEDEVNDLGAFLEAQ